MKPYFNKNIFWDIDTDHLDYQAKAEFIISRVFERGDIEDIRQCRNFYSAEKIEKTILNINFLPEHRINLAATIINHDKTELKCYKSRLLNQKLYPY